MRAIETLISARHVVPVRPRGAVLDDHAVAVDKGHVVSVLPTHEALDKFDAEERIHLDSHILLPGLINAHTHTPMSLLKGIGGGLPMQRWLHECIFPLERDLLTPQFVRDGAELAIAEMIRGGITCFSDMYYFPKDAIDVACRARVRICCGLVVLEFETAYAADAGEYIRKGLEIHDQYKNDGRVHLMFAPHAPYTVSDETFTRIRTYSDELNLPVHVHLHETADEVRDGVEKHGARPIARLERLGLITPALRAVHMTQLTEEEIELLARRNAHVVHCPESNMKLASGICPVRSLLAHGVNVALGTDGSASNDDLDVLGEMRSAALLAAVSGAAQDDARPFDAAGALDMATINGAEALGIGKIAGSIEKGKAADLTAVECTTIEAIPLHDVIGHLVYSAGRGEVSDVWIGGQRVLRERVLTTIDEQALCSETEKWRRKIAARLAANHRKEETEPSPRERVE